MAAALASTFATTITHPADVLKTRLQLQRYTTSSENCLSSTQMIRKMASEEGARVFALGLLPRISKRVLSSTITWTCFELLMSVLDSSA